MLGRPVGLHISGTQRATHAKELSRWLMTLLFCEHLAPAGHPETTRAPTCGTRCDRARGSRRAPSGSRHSQRHCTRSSRACTPKQYLHTLLGQAAGRSRLLRRGHVLQCFSRSLRLAPPRSRRCDRDHGRAARSSAPTSDWRWSDRPGITHARSGAMGFCLLNNVADRGGACPRTRCRARRDRRLRRAPRQWDTRGILRGPQSVLYVSLHQSPLYPGTGAAR